MFVNKAHGWRLIKTILEPSVRFTIVRLGSATPGALGVLGSVAAENTVAFFRLPWRPSRDAWGIVSIVSLPMPEIWVTPSAESSTVFPRLAANVVRQLPGAGREEEEEEEAAECTGSSCLETVRETTGESHGPAEKCRDSTQRWELKSKLRVVALQTHTHTHSKKRFKPFLEVTHLNIVWYI